MQRTNDVLYIDEDMQSRKTSVEKNENSNEGVKLKVNFGHLDLSDSEEDGLNLDIIDRNCPKRNASNLNRDAKLKYQTNIIQKKHSINHFENPIKTNINKHHLKSFSALNSTSIINNNENNGIDYDHGSFENSSSNSRRMQTHQIQEGEEEISNINKDICKIVTPLNFLAGRDSKNVTGHLNNGNNLPFNSKSASTSRNINHNKDLKNEIVVKSIKIHAVTEEDVKNYSSDSDSNSMNSIQAFETPKIVNSVNNINNNKIIPRIVTSKYLTDESGINSSNIKVNPIPVIQEPNEYEESSIIEIKTEVESEETEELEKSSEDSIDLSIFELLDKNSKKFILKPATMGLTLKCQIFRHKGIYPQYKFYLENLEGQLLLIMTARKKKRTKTTFYIINYISYDETDVEKYIETPIAKLRSNLLGTEFTLYDFGIKPGRLRNDFATNISNASNLSTGGISTNDENFFEETNDSLRNADLKYLRKEYLSVEYDFNIFGYKGPRQMSIIIPGMDNDFQREDFYIRNQSDSMLSTWRSTETNLQRQKVSSKVSKKSPSKFTGDATGSSKQVANSNETQSKSECEDESEETTSKQSSIKDDDQANVVKLINKTPGWHPQYRSFALNFNGRVTRPSVKNYQIVHEVNTDYIVTQFGKVNTDMYTCDYSYPMCSLQAFGIAISSMDNKIGCD